MDEATARVQANTLVNLINMFDKRVGVLDNLAHCDFALDMASVLKEPLALLKVSFRTICLKHQHVELLKKINTNN